MTVTVSGNTWNHRDKLNRMGGFWDSKKRIWHFPFMSQAEFNELRGTVGLLVIGEPKDHPPPLTVEAWDGLTDVEISDIVDDILSLTDKPRKSIERTEPSKIYGDDQTYHNYFAPQNPVSFFGFSTLDQLIDYVEGLPPGDFSAWAIGDRNIKFTGTASMNEAIALARNGWQDGAEAAAELMAHLALDKPVTRRPKPSLAGGSVNVGRMLAGDPLHMVRRQKQPGRKVVTFFVEVSALANVHPMALTVRAAIIGAIVDLMESVGYACNIVATCVSNCDQQAYFQCAVNIKRSNQRLNVPDIIFALGHPSYLRRFMFAMANNRPELRAMWIDQGYATNAFDKDHRCKPNEFYVPVLKKTHDNDLATILPLVIPDGLPIEIKRV